MLRCSLYVHNWWKDLEWILISCWNGWQRRWKVQFCFFSSFEIWESWLIIGFLELKAFFILLHHHDNLNFKSKHYINFKNKLVRFQEVKLSGPLFKLKDNIQAHKYNQQLHYGLVPDRLVRGIRVLCVARRISVNKFSRGGKFWTVW